MAEGVLDIVHRFWDSLYARDWDTLRSHLDERSFYEDVPSPDVGAQGPDAIVRRLRIGFDKVDEHEHEWRNVTTDDDGVVMIEHAETWHWPTGESVTLPFVTVMEVDADAGVITRWSDYWNYDTLLGAAPKWWVDDIVAEFFAEPFAQPTDS